MKVRLGIGTNPSKASAFSYEERVETALRFSLALRGFGFASSLRRALGIAEAELRHGKTAPPSRFSHGIGVALIVSMQLSTSHRTVEDYADRHGSSDW